VQCNETNNVVRCQGDLIPSVFKISMILVELSMPKNEKRTKKPTAAGITFEIPHRLSFLWLEPINSKLDSNHSHQ
jgi:hypothetical protein